MIKKEDTEDIRRIIDENKVDGLFYLKEGKDIFIKSSNESITEYSFFTIGGMSAHYYSFLAMILYQQGIINIFQKISSYDERLPKYITIYDIMMHEAGIEDISLIKDLEKNSPHDLNYYVDIMLKNKSIIFDRNKYHRRVYTFSNYFLFAHIIERITGRDHREIMRKEVFERMKLKDILFSSEIVWETLEKPQKAEHPWGKANIIIKEDNLVKGSIPRPKYLTGIIPSLDIVTTVNSFINFMTNRDDYLIEPFHKMFYMIHPRKTLSYNLYYALVGFLYKNEGGKYGDGKVYMISGIGNYYPGFNSSLGIDIEKPKNRVILLMSNAEKSDIGGMLPQDVAKYSMISISTGSRFYFKPKDSKQFPLTKEDIDAIQGKYINEYTSYEVYAAADGDLVLATRRQVIKLFHMGNREFFRSNISIIKFPDDETLSIEYMTGEKFEMKKTKEDETVVVKAPPDEKKSV